LTNNIFFVIRREKTYIYELKRIFMEYKTLKKLLLGTEVITATQADEIMDYWEDNPRAYHNFLKNEEASQPMMGYIGVNSNGLIHDFVELKTVVPSVAVAEKFFSLRDADITVRFVKLLDFLSGNSTHEICAWPYLTSKCMKHFDKQSLMAAVNTMWFVFDFNEDKHGSLFDSLLARLDTDAEKEMFAAASFNTLGWIQKVSANPLRKLLKLFMMSYHFMNIGVGPEAMFRKFYIRYRNDVENLVDDMDNASNPPETSFDFPCGMLGGIPC